MPCATGKFWKMPANTPGPSFYAIHKCRKCGGYPHGIYVGKSRSTVGGGAGMSQICPRFGRGRHENSPFRGLCDQPPSDMS